MATIKKVAAGAIAVTTGYLALKVIMWVFGLIFSLTITLVMYAAMFGIIALIAVPVYAFVRKKLFRDYDY